MAFKRSGVRVPSAPLERGREYVPVLVVLLGYDLKLLFQEFLNFSRFCMASGLQFGIDEFPIHTDFKPTPIGWNDRNGFDGVLKAIQQSGHQTGSTRGVLSNGAVFDSDVNFLHLSLLSGSRMMSFVILNAPCYN